MGNDGETQMKLRSLSRRSPPAVRPVPNRLREPVPVCGPGGGGPLLCGVSVAYQLKPE